MPTVAPARDRREPVWRRVATLRGSRSRYVSKFPAGNRVGSTSKVRPGPVRIAAVVDHCGSRLTSSPAPGLCCPPSARDPAEWPGRPARKRQGDAGPAQGRLVEASSRNCLRSRSKETAIPPPMAHGNEPRPRSDISDMAMAKVKSGPSSRGRRVAEPRELATMPDDGQADRCHQEFAGHDGGGVGGDAAQYGNGQPPDRGHCGHVGPQPTFAGLGCETDGDAGQGQRGGGGAEKRTGDGAEPADGADQALGWFVVVVLEQDHGGDVRRQRHQQHHYRRWRSQSARTWAT